MKQAAIQVVLNFNWPVQNESEAKSLCKNITLDPQDWLVNYLEDYDMSLKVKAHVVHVASSDKEDKKEDKKEERD